MGQQGVWLEDFGHASEPPVGLQKVDWTSKGACHMPGVPYLTFQLCLSDCREGKTNTVVSCPALNYILPHSPNEYGFCEVEAFGYNY